MGWACSTYGGKGEVCTGFWCGNLRELDHLEHLSARWEDNIKMDIQKVGSGSGLGQVAGTCECGSEPSGSVKC